MFTTWPYSWRHIKTGETGTCRVMLDSVRPEETLLRNLNRWNQQGNGEWVYWTDSIGVVTPIDSFTFITE